MTLAAASLLSERSTRCLKVKTLSLRPAVHAPSCSLPPHERRSPENQEECPGVERSQRGRSSPSHWWAGCKVRMEGGLGQRVKHKLVKGRQQTASGAKPRKMGVRKGA